MRKIIILMAVLSILGLPLVSGQIVNSSLTPDSGWTTQDGTSQFDAQLYNFSGSLIPQWINWKSNSGISSGEDFQIFGDTTGLLLFNGTESSGNLNWTATGWESVGAVESVWLVFNAPSVDAHNIRRKDAAPLTDNGLTASVHSQDANSANLNVAFFNSDATLNNHFFVYEVIMLNFTGAPTFTTTLVDTYDGISLSNFTLTIFNSTFSITNTTTTGTITHTGLIGGNMDINFSLVTDNGGYFNQSFSSINTGSSFEGDVFQSVLRLMALDGLNNDTILNFTAVTNLSSDSTGVGQVLILAKEGHFQLNVTAAGFETLVTNFTILALQNNSLNVTLGSVFNFQLIREITNSVFDFNSTNSTVLNVFCPNETIVINFSSSSNQSRIINCEFTLLQVVVDYGALGSYFRTLIPPFSQKSINIYLIDLIAGDTAIQRIIKLIDLTQTFTNSILTVNRAVGSGTVDIIEQRFDISNEVNLFLVKDSLYTLKVSNGVEEIILGNLIPTEAGTQTITLPKLNFVPQETVIGTNISWSYTFNSSTGLLRVQYLDKSEKTTKVKFTIMNESAGGAVVFTGESNNNFSVTITYNQAFGNHTFSTELFFEHPDIINATEKRVFFQLTSGSAVDFEGWSAEDEAKIKKWAAWIFLVVWIMFFSQVHAGVALVSMVGWLWIFRKLGWIVGVSDLIFGFVVLLAIVTWMLESMRKN